MFSMDQASWPESPMRMNEIQVFTDSLFMKTIVNHMSMCVQEKALSIIYTIL